MVWYTLYVYHTSVFDISLTVRITTSTISTTTAFPLPRPPRVGSGYWLCNNNKRATTPKHISAKTTTTTPTQSQRYRENNKNNNKNLSLNYVLVSPSCAPFHPLPPSFSIYAYRQLYTDDQKPPIVIMLLSSPKVY
jgi:hypothetical protein